MATLNGSLNLKDEYVIASSLEHEHVHKVYDATARCYRQARLHCWPHVVHFIESLEPGSIIADIGCGQGKYLDVNSSVFSLGSDYSEKLALMARSHGHEVMVCNALHLPYRDHCFDAVISVGVIHHLTTTKRRAAALQEAGRVLRPGGKAMICVWAMEQKHRKFKAQDVLVPWRLKSRKAKKSKSSDSVKETFSTNGKATSKWSVILKKRLGIRLKSMSNSRHPEESDSGHVNFKGNRLQKQRRCKSLGEGDSSPEQHPHQNRPRSTSGMEQQIHHKSPASVELSHASTRAHNESFDSAFSQTSSEEDRPSQSVADILISKLQHVFKGHSKSEESVSSAVEDDAVLAKNAKYEDILKYIMQEERDFVKQQAARTYEADGKRFAVRQFPCSSQLENCEASNPRSNSIVARYDAAAMDGFSEQRSDPDLAGSACIAQKIPTSYQDTSIKQMRKHSNISKQFTNVIPHKVWDSIISTKQVHVETTPSNGNHVTQACFHENQECDSPVMFHIGGSNENSPTESPSSMSQFLYPDKSASYTDSNYSVSSDWKDATSQVIDTLESNLEQQHYRISPSKNSLDSVFMENSHNGFSAEKRQEFKVLRSLRRSGSSGLSCNSSFSSFSSDAGSDNSDTENLATSCADKDSISNTDILRSPGACTSSCTTRRDKLQSRIISSDNSQLKRYYHVFREGELVSLIKNFVPNLHVINVYYDHANWCVIVEKKPSV